MITTFLRNSVSLLVLLLFASWSHAGQSIILWHSLEQPLAQQFIAIVEQFNRTPESVAANIKVVPEFKGNYEQTLKAGLKAVGTAQAPQILQVYDAGNLVMQASPHVYVPLDKLDIKESEFLKSSHFYPAISEFYKDRHGRKALPSLPFSTYSVVVFYNKDAFRKAGLDPEHPPETWEQFEKIAPLLKSAATRSVMASTWLSGHHIEQLGAWHNQPVATQGNGVDAEGAILQINKPFFIEHLNKLSEWYQMGFFSLDVGIKANQAFADGEVVFLTDSANHLNVIERLVDSRFEIGVAKFPFWKSKVERPYNTAIAGASFWALAGHRPEIYPIIQRFFEYLVNGKTQAEWHQRTCYMPVVVDAREEAERQGFYKKGLKGRVAELAIESFTGNLPQEYSRGILLPQYTRVREVIVQEMKEAIKGNKTAAQALDQIVILGNMIMLEGVSP